MNARLGPCALAADGRAATARRARVERRCIIGFLPPLPWPVAFRPSAERSWCRGRRDRARGPPMVHDVVERARPCVEGRDGQRDDGAILVPQACSGDGLHAVASRGRAEPAGAAPSGRRRRRARQASRSCRRRCRSACARSRARRHAHGLEGTAGDGGRDVAGRVDRISQRAQVGGRMIGLQGAREVARLGYDQVTFYSQRRSASSSRMP